MQWIKDHLHIVASGAVALVAIGLLIVGLLNSEPAEALEADAREMSALRSLQGQPVNSRVIDAARERLEHTRERVQATLEQVQEVSSHEPLLPKLFPTPRSTDLMFDFPPAYRAKYQEFLERLNAGDTPSADEIKALEERIEDARKEAERQRELGGRPRREAPTGESARRPERTDLPWEELIEERADARASVIRAQEIYCYATMDSLDPRPSVLTERRPTIEDMWYAQMSLWIQEDMVNAIAALNDRVAEQLKEQGQLPWVGNLPIKRLVSVSMDGFAPPSGAAADDAPGARRGGAGVERTLESFTGRSSTESVDVIHFTLVLIVDARRLPMVIDQLCSAGFYTPFLINYETAQTSPDLSGHIYGEDPVVELTLNMEAAFLRSKYAEMMPESVAEQIREGAAAGIRSAATTGGGTAPRRPTQPRPAAS